MGIKIRKKSFTLIEMVVVVGVLGFALPVLFSIIFLIIRQQSRIYSLQELKRQGDSAFFSIQSTIQQNATSVVDPNITPYPPYPTIIDNCPVLPAATPSPAPYIFLYDKNGTFFSYFVEGTNQIASHSAAGNGETLYLTNSKVKVEQNDLKFSCYRTNQFSPPIIWATFKITQNDGIDPNPSSMQYSTRFQLRSY